MKTKKTKAVIKGITAFLMTFILLAFYSQVQAQLATYPLATGGANPTPGTINPAASNPNVNAGKMLYGSDMGNSHNSQGYRTEYNGSEDYWPTVPTASCSFDFPFSPNPGFDLTITGITANINSPNNSPTLKIQPYFQIDGAGPWIPLSNALDVTSATTSLNFPVNESFFNGHTYVIRFYVFGVGSADDNEDFRIRDLVFNGTTQAPATKPTVTTLTAIKSPAKPKYEGIATGKYDFGPAFQLVKEVGVVWSTSANPDVSLATKTTNGAAGTINSTITGLVAGTLYHVRAYIVTQLGTYYGADLTFTTDPPSKPVVTTNPIPPANIFSNKVIAGGAITDSGGLAITEKGLVWNNGGGATTTTNLGKWIAGSGSSSYSDFIKGLKPNTNYCVNAYAINSLGTSYGTDVCFKTGAPVPVLAAIPGNLDFGENFFGGAAITLSYTLEGSNLNPASGNITIQVPAGYSMGTSSSALTKGPATITVAYAGSSFSKPIYVQLPTTAYANNLTGTITHSGGGVAAGDADVVKVTGSIVQSPDDVSNKGTEFWTGFGYQETMRNPSGDPGECHMSIYISNSGTSPVTATIELPGIPGAAAFPQTVTIQPGTVFEKTGFPTGDPTDSRLYFTGVTDRGIHITSSAPVSVWMHTYADNNSAAATMLFPTNTWGSAYTVQSYGGQSNNANPASFFFVIAKDDNTLIEFTPANDVIANIASLYFKDNNTPADVLYHKGQTYQITLNRGQVFNAMGYIQGTGKGVGAGKATGLDLTGTPVKAICDNLNPNGEEKKIAVFAGNSRVLVLDPGCGASQGSDHLIQQMFPTVAWGTDYLTAPTRTMEWNMFRIMPRNMAAKVSVNGVLLTAANIPAGASYYQVSGNQPLHITSDLPICVTQFILAGDCAKNHGSQPAAGDPEMIILSPTQQAIKNVTVYSSNIKKNPGGCGSSSASYINVIIKKEGVASFTYDGAPSVDLGTPNTFKSAGSLTPSATAFKPHPADPNYMYAQIFATCGKSHTIKSDYSFNAIAYGMGDGESYGYNAGTALKNLSSIKIADNPTGYDTSTTVVRTCKDNLVALKIALPYNTNLVDSVIWDPGNDPRISPLGAKKGAMNGAIAKTDGNPIIQDGRTFNVYKSPVDYKFSEIGAYKFTVIAYGKFDSDCGNRDVQKIIVVVGKDNIAFDYNPPSCGSTIITFADKTEPMAGTTLKSWAWDFGDKTPINNTQNPPAHTYAPNPPTYWVKLKTENSVGCFSIDSALIDFSGGMKARFLADADTVCPGSPVNFSNGETSTSDGSSGTLTEWNWDFGDTKTYKGTSPATANPPAHIYDKTGTYTVKLVVKSSLGCSSLPVDTTIIVKPVPVPNFDLPGGICIPGSTLFKNTSTITDGTTLTYSWDFDDAANSTPANPNVTTDNDGTHIYTVAPPTPPGYYAVKLKAVSEFGCFEDTIKQVKDVFSPPVADFKLPTGSEVCLNSDSSFVSTSTATGGQTFSNYAWDFGDGSAIQSGANLQTIKHLFDIEGSKDVKLVVTTNKGCIDSITQPINVATPPVADFSWSANTCVGNEVTFTDGSTPDAKFWSWKFGDNNISDLQSPLHTYTQSGPVKPILQVFTAAGCPSKPDSNDLVINPSPVADFTLPLGICLPGSTTFVNTTTISDGTFGTITYLWDFDDAGVTSTDVDGVHTYTGAKPGGYNVSLTATSINGCFDDTVKNVIDVFEPPVAIFTVDRTALCEKQSVIFTNASTVTGNQKVNKWDWVFGDNSPNGTDSIVSHPYDAFASYDATLTVTTDKGCVSTISAPQTITVNQNPIVSYPGHPGICLEATVRALTEASETTGLPGSFTYSGPGVESDGGRGYQFNPATSGGANTTTGYPVEALYVTSDGCRDSTTSPMKVFPTPVADWTTGLPACEQNGTGFTDASDPGYGKIIAWKWDMLGDGNINVRGNPAAFSYTYPQADTFNVSLQVSTDSGCTSAITTIPLAIHYLPRVDVNLPGVLCLPDATGTFKDMSTIPDGTENQFKYKWDFGDGNSSLQKDPSHTYHAAGASPYKIQLTVTSSNGCVDSLPQRISLTNIYPPPVAEFEASPTEVCQGEDMQFTDKSDGVTSPVNKWFWRFGDGGIDSVASLSHTFSRANYFDVKLTVTNGEGCSASSIRRVKVNAYPKIEMPDNIYIKPGTSTVLRPQVTDINSTNVSYSWTPGLYLDRTDIKNPMSQPPADQVYVLTVVAGTGCSSTDSIKVNLLIDLKPPNAFSPNGDGINDTWKIPNLEFYAGCEIQVFDRYGRIAYKTTGYNKPWDGTTGGKQLPTGVYYYIIDPKNGYEKFTGSVTILR